MLKKQFRLSSDFEHKVTRKYGKRYNYPLFNVFVCKPLNYTGGKKIGFVVPTSVLKSAAKRNRTKRLFREAVRKNLENIPSGYWVLFYPKAISFGEKYENISSEINKALSEIHFIG